MKATSQISSRMPAFRIGAHLRAVAWTKDTSATDASLDAVRPLRVYALDSPFVVGEPCFVEPDLDFLPLFM